MELGYALSGLLVGFIVGLTGVGGGSLMTPLLVMVFGISPATAVGTDLLYASLTKATGVWVHARRGNVEWKLVGWLATGSIPAAVVALVALHFMGVDSHRVSGLITGSLGVALILTALAILFKEKLQRLGRQGDGPKWRERYAFPATVVTGAVIGALVALSSVGAGAVGVAALFWLFPLLPASRIVGSDIAHAVPLTFVAGMGHFYMGTVDWHLLLNLLIGSLPGIYIGSHLSGRIAERWLRPALASMLVLVGGKLVF
ncbi:MAG TPA: sulfite exporter TauE/SafE family protein [Burkholderiales bacterium]|nr:sulfite exporter TauE/SafE family protein [Burkholderiales bacterium]